MMASMILRKFSSLNDLRDMGKEDNHNKSFHSMGDLNNIDFSRKLDALTSIRQDPAVLDARVGLDIDDILSTSSGFDRPLFPEDENRGRTPFVPEAYLSPMASYREMVQQHRAALNSISPHQRDLLLRYVDTLRRQRQNAQRAMECAFCKNNGDPPGWYSSHVLKDGRGRVLCPVLREYHCPRCGATGDRAHTIKYCPENL